MRRVWIGVVVLFTVLGREAACGTEIGSVGAVSSGWSSELRLDRTPAEETVEEPAEAEELPFGGRPGAYTVDIGAVLQFRYTVSAAPSASDPDDDAAYGFAFRRLRPRFMLSSEDGRIRLFLQAEAADGSADLLDGWVAFEPAEGWQLRLGRIHVGFGRDQEVFTFRMLAAEQSAIANTVNPDEGARIQGAELQFTGEPHRIKVILAEGFGVADAGFNDPVADWSITSRYNLLLIGDSFKQFDVHTAPRGTPRGLMLGLAGHAQHLKQRGDRVAFAADLSYQENGFNWMLAFEGRIGEDKNRDPLNEPESAYGIVTHAGYYVTDRIEPFARYEWGTTSDGDHPDLNIITVGANYYVLGQAFKLTADLSVALDGVGPAFDRPGDGLIQTPEGADRWYFRAQVQMMF
jgi:hypothetical protein